MPAIAPLVATDRRSGEILDSIRQIFAAKGFDGASMQDLARAANMSVGNFYRYFPSKAAIIDAMISRDLEDIERDFAVVIDSADPMQTMRGIFRHRISNKVCADDGPMLAEITAAALRKPEIAAVVGRMETLIAQYILVVFERVTGLPAAEVGRRFMSHAGLIMMLIKGCTMVPASQPSNQSDLAALVLRTIDSVLDEVSAARVKGIS